MQKIEREMERLCYNLVTRVWVRGIYVLKVAGSNSSTVVYWMDIFHIYLLQRIVMFVFKEEN